MERKSPSDQIYVRVRDQNPTGPEGPDATALLCAFVAVLQAGARFPTNSPRLLDPCRDLLRVMRTQLAQRDRLTIRTCAEGLRVGPENTLFARSLPDVSWAQGRLEAAGLEGVDVTPGTSPELIAALASALRKAAAPGSMPFAQFWGVGGPGIDVWARGTAPDVRPFGRPDVDVHAEPRAGLRLGDRVGANRVSSLGRSDATVRPRPLLRASPRIAPRASSLGEPPSRVGVPNAHVPTALADQLARETRVRDAIGRIRHRFEQEYADRELLDIDEMLGELLRALPVTELASSEAAAHHVARALERVVDQLEDFLRSNPTRPGEALQQLALAQIPASGSATTVTRPNPLPHRTPSAEPTAPEAPDPLVDGFPDTLPGWLDAADAADPSAARALREAMQRVGEGVFLAETLRLVTRGDLLTPARVERLLALAGPAAAPMAAVLATKGATWTRALVVEFLGRCRVPDPGSGTLRLLELADLPAAYVADLCGSIGADSAPEALTRWSLDLLRRFCEGSAGDPFAQDRRIAALDVIASCSGAEASEVLEHLSRTGQFVDRSPGARRFRAAAAAALRRQQTGPG